MQEPDHESLAGLRAKSPGLHSEFVKASDSVELVDMQHHID